MTHLTLDKSAITSWCQWLISKGNLIMASDVVNLLGYWGGDYAESIFQRIAGKIPAEYLS